MNSRVRIKTDVGVAKIDEVVTRLNKIWGIAAVRISTNELFVASMYKDCTDYADAVINTEFKGVPYTYQHPARKLVKASTKK